jgi:hypothetical protein
MAAPDTVVDFAEKLAAFDEQWSPKIVGQVNDLHVKVVKVLGEFVWHQHDDTDETFIVLAGRLTIRLEGRDDVELGPGQMFIVGDLAGLWSASASEVLRLTFVRTPQGRKTLVRCTRHYDR